MKRKLILIGLLLFTGCQEKDITSSLKNPMAEAAKTFCNQAGKNLVGYDHYEYNHDKYEIECGGWIKK